LTVKSSLANFSHRKKQPFKCLLTLEFICLSVSTLSRIDGDKDKKIISAS